MGIAGVVLALAMSLLQASQNAPRVLGMSADAAELTRIRQLSSGAAGGAPWLVVSSTGQVTNHWTIEAYGPPRLTDANASVRRGVVVRLVRAVAASGAQATLTFYDSRPYAMVPLQGRAPDDVRDKSDVNVPFTIGAEFTDDEIVEIVRFVRSSPPGPAGRPTGVDVARHSIAAIGRFRRAADTDVHEGVVVSFRLGDLRGAWFELERNGTGWFVAQTGGWIA